MFYDISLDMLWRETRSKTYNETLLTLALRFPLESTSENVR